MSARDDVMPTAKEEPWDVVTGADAGIINGVSGENMFNYKYSHESGFMLQTAYLPSGTALAYLLVTAVALFRSTENTTPMSWENPSSKSSKSLIGLSI